MNKANLTYNVTEENSEDFAVIPHEQLNHIYQMVNVLDNQLSVLKTALSNAGIDGYTYNKAVKTLADIKITGAVNNGTD